MSDPKPLVVVLVEVLDQLPSRPVSDEANEAWEQAKLDIERHDREFKQRLLAATPDLRDLDGNEWEQVAKKMRGPVFPDAA